MNSTFFSTIRIVFEYQIIRQTLQQILWNILINPAHKD